MAIRRVAPNGSAASNGIAPNTHTTLANACTSAVAGDEIELADGVYSSATMTGGVQPEIKMGNSGTQANPIAVRAASEGGAILRRSASGATYATPTSGGTPVPKSWITLSGLSFDNTAGTWLSSKGASHHFVVEDCAFTSNHPSGGEWDDIIQSYAASDIRGNFVEIRRCTFPRWMGGDAIVCWGNNALVEYCDFGESGHGPVHTYGGGFVYQHNFVRNKWARAGHFAPPPGAANPVGGVVQYNVFYDCNYINAANEGYPATGTWALSPYSGTPGNPQPNAIGDGDAPGDAQIIKGGGTGLIFRFNLLLAANPSSYRTLDGSGNPTGYASGYNYACMIQINNYDNTVYYQKGRYYHNAIVDNPFHAFTINLSSGPTPTFDDNRFFNNVLHNNFDRAFYVTDATIAAQQEVRNNLITDPIRWGGSTHTTMAAFETAVGAGVASGNIGNTPIFVDDDYSAADISQGGNRDEANRPTLAQFELAPSSPGYTSGRHLTHLSVAANNTQTITVEDAYCFTDGNGLTGVTPDRLLILGQSYEIVLNGINRTAGTILLNGFVTAPINTPVYLEVTGSTPPMGIVAPAEDEEPVALTISDLRHLRTYGSTTASATHTLDAAISPTPRSLVVAVVAFRYEGPNAAPSVTSVTSTFDTIDGWTQRVENVRLHQIDQGIAIWTAQVGSNPGSGTITATASGGPPSGWKMTVTELDTHDISLPFVQAQSLTNTATTGSMTLAATPLTGSMVIAAVFSRGDADGVTPSTGFTEVSDHVTGTVPLQVQFNKTNPTTTVGWAGMLTNGNVAAAIEIAVADASKHYMFAEDTLTGDVDYGEPALGYLHNLTATTLSTAAPTLGTPILSQPHALTASNLATAVYTAAMPLLAQTHVLTTADVATGAPALATPALEHVVTGGLAAVSLVTGTPDLEEPDMDQHHMFLAAIIMEG